MRVPYLNIVLGHNGTGKTTFIKQLIEKSSQAGRRVLVVTPDDIEWPELPEISHSEIYNFQGVKKAIYEPALLPAIYRNFHNGLLVMDDFKAFGISSKEDITTLRQLAVRRRQRMMDIAIAAHGFTEVVPLFLYTFSTHIVLFRTIDNIQRVLHVLKEGVKMKQMQAEINQRATTEPHFYKIIKQ
jgi:GTPase SAR1 family protein